MNLREPAIPMPDFRALFESAPGLYLVLTPDQSFTIVAVSDNYLRATMTVREEILGRGLFEVFPDNPNDPAASGVHNLRASLERVQRNLTSDAMAVQKYDIRRPESEGGGFEERYWSPVNSPVLAPDGTLAHIIHRVEDVTAFIRLKQMGSAQEGLVEELKTRAARMESEIFLRAQQLQEANARIQHLNEDLERRVEERTAELRRTEEQLRHAQKMEAVGRLTGGIAHDFNNMLVVIVNYASLVLNDLDPADPKYADLEQIKKAGDRATTLTQQLLAFSRQQVVQPKIMDLNATVTEMEKMLRRLVGENIELAVHLQPTPAYIHIDPGQLEQVLANLVVNARDAMPQGGRLIIETRSVELDEQYAHDEIGVDPGRYVVLAVSDTGIGMDAATRARIFEPFFTTKERGKGTGLGLATVHGIVKQARGNIWVYSESGHGTVLKIYLPEAAASSQSTKSRSTTPPLALGGAETILVVEDEDLVREATRAALRRNGYTVLIARSGSEALRVCGESTNPIDLMITDMIMPGMNGRELAERLMTVRPETRVLYTSGYTDHALGNVLAPDIAFIPKPFTSESLLSKVREILDPVARERHCRGASQDAVPSAAKRR